MFTLHPLKDKACLITALINALCYYQIHLMPLRGAIWGKVDATYTLRYNWVDLGPTCFKYLLYNVLHNITRNSGEEKGDAF